MKCSKCQRDNPEDAKFCIGKTICLGEASVEDDKGNLVAYGTSTMMVLDSVKIQGQSKLPPKFLDES